MPPPRASAIVVVVIFGCLACAGGEEVRVGDAVAVQLRSGVILEGRLIAQDAASVTIAHGGGRVTLRREVIRRIAEPGEEMVLPAVDGSATRPATGAAEDDPGSLPWSDDEEKKIESLLDRYFTATGEAARKAVHAELAATPLKRTVAELERMRAAGEATETFYKHLPVPWRRGTPRGWYNLTLPAGYAPAKAWPLVIALHGMPSDGDNLPGWYGRWFSRRGYIVLYPTTIHASSWWPAPDEKRDLLRLLRLVCRTYRVDYRRIFCTGGSGGGIGTWHWLVTLPELFAGGISYSAAGTVLDARLKKLRHVPFYVHHGTEDFVPIASPRRAVALARKHGAEGIVFHEAKGGTHHPTREDWERGFAWLAKLPPKQASPRYLLESTEGELPAGYETVLPFAAVPDRDALAEVLAARKPKAAKWTFPKELPAADLVEGLAAVGRIVDPTCDAAAVGSEIDRLARAAAGRIRGGDGPIEKLAALNEVFFQAEGLVRDPADPTGEKPDGLVVSRVLANRAGSAATLAGVYAAVGRKLGLPVRPVVTPYHTFVRHDDGTTQLNVELTESGGSFADSVYLRGYGLRAMPGGAEPDRTANAKLLAWHAAALGLMARQAGQKTQASAAAKLALSLDPDCYRAIVLTALGERDERRFAGAVRTIRRLTARWPDYAAPRMLEGELLAALGDKIGAVRAYRAAIAAPIKPHARTKGYDAELYFRIAEIYAPLARAALDRNQPAGLRYMRLFHKNIVECLRNNRRHDRARDLFTEMGGKFVKRGGPSR